VAVGIPTAKVHLSYPIRETTATLVNVPVNPHILLLASTNVRRMQTNLEGIILAPALALMSSRSPIYLRKARIALARGSSTNIPLRFQLQCQNDDA
jgi:hypothetical protein